MMPPFERKCDAIHLCEPLMNAVPPPPGTQSDKNTKIITPWYGCPSGVRCASVLNPAPMSKCQPRLSIRLRLTGCHDLAASSSSAFGSGDPSPTCLSTIFADLSSKSIIARPRTCFFVHEGRTLCINCVMYCHFSPCSVTAARSAASCSGAHALS